MEADILEEYIRAKKLCLRRREMVDNIEFYRYRLSEGFDRKTCRIIPAIMRDGKDTAYMISTYLSLTGADVFSGAEISKSCDGGITFGEPHKLNSYEVIEYGIRTIFGIDSLHYHMKTGKFLCFGRTTHYADDKRPVHVNGVATTEPYLSVIDTENDQFGELIPIPLPYQAITAVPHGQIIEDDDGNMLVTFYGAAMDDTRSRAITILYSFDGEKIEIVKSGAPLLSGPEHRRGYDEPSVAKLADKYYMTIRTDEAAYLSVSDDGFNFCEPFKWTFDDGEEIGSINTQQRWLRFDDELYLVYTRKTQYNGHIFRNRAPLFTARFDPERLCLIKESERVLVPELGARLGNFQVCDVSGNEGWVTVGEWMQADGINTDEWKTCMRYGSNNTLWRVRVIKN